MGEVYNVTRSSGRTPAACYHLTSSGRSSVAEFFPLNSLVGNIFTRLVTLTSYITHRFVRFIEDLAFNDVERRHACDCSHAEWGRYESNVYESDTDENSNAPHHIGRKTSAHNNQHYTNRRSEIIVTESSSTDSFCRRLISSYLRSFSIYVGGIRFQVRSFMDRLSRTFHGSSDDIGWLESSEFLPVKDGTERFLYLLNCIRNGEHCLPNSFVYLLIPGLFSNHSPLYFLNTKKFFSKMGLACHIAKIHSEASVEKNSWEIKQYIEELYWGSGKRVMILGHSKGGVDAAAALALYWPELRNKVGGLALVQSPYGGSPMASDILREGQVADREARRIMEFIVCKLIKGDLRALEDLTYDKRKEFVSRHCLPSNEIPIVSFHTEAGLNPGVLATMSHIAHAELPWLPLPNFIREAEQESTVKLPVVIPLSAAMAVSALHLKLRYGEKSDGLVTRRDAEVPGSVVVRPDRKLDHAWMVYSFTKHNLEADASEMCEALLTLLVEIGKSKKRCGRRM